MVYDFEKRINEWFRTCFQTEIERKKETRKEPSFLSFRGLERNRVRALKLESTPLDKGMRGAEFRGKNRRLFSSALHSSEV
jgi:hypothetical protein